MAQIAGLTVVNAAEMPRDRLKMLITGSPGSGKSTLASSIAELGPTLFVDLNGEKGIQSFRGAPWEANVNIVRPDSITAMDDLFWALKAGGHGYQAVVIDSVSAYSATCLRFLLGYDETTVMEIKKGRPGAKIQTWGELKSAMTDLAVFWYGLADGDNVEPMHVIMTCQVKVGEDDDGNERLIPDVSAGSLTPTMAAPDFVGYADREEWTSDEGVIAVRHILNLGFDVRYATKAHLPFGAHGKIPSVLGRGGDLRLLNFAKALGIVK